MRHSFINSSGTFWGLLAALAVASCSAKEGIEPAAPCDTTATVRLCHGKTSVCLTEHTNLELADGTQLRPRGSVWEAYLPRQVNGQVLRISYRLLPQNAYDNPGVTLAELSCLEANYEDAK